MSKVPDAWEDEWSAAVDDGQPTSTELVESKKISSKVSKAQRRAQQAEFNRQLWAEAEGPKETNYFLESRNVVPLRSEYKPPPVLLSRKGPAVKTKPPRAPTTGIQDLTLGNDNASRTPGQESSEDEDEAQARELTQAERKAQAAKEREEKQRRYDERRKELFGNASASTGPTNQKQGTHNHSGASTPSSLTPPNSRSATPSRGRGGRGGRRGGGIGDHNTNSRAQSKSTAQQREQYEPLFAPKPDAAPFVPRREREIGSTTTGASPAVLQPIRTPRGPDGSGRGGFGFVRMTKSMQNEAPNSATTETTQDHASAIADLG